MADHIKIREIAGTWVVRAGGAVLGESNNALEVTEGELSPVIYFPREDIAMEFLDTSDARTSHTHFGDAEYFSIVTKSTTLKDAVWSYANPRSDLSKIAGHLAFSIGDLVTVEEV